MIHCRKNLQSQLDSALKLSPLSSVGKSEIASRCSCVLQCSSIINDGDAHGGLMTVLKHTRIGKEVLDNLVSPKEGVFLLLIIFIF
jgi:hypothetical protein